MTKERAYEIASIHATLETGTVSWYALADGRNLHIQTLEEPSYFDDTDYVTYVDTEDDDGDCIETHTTKPNDVENIAFWVYEMCYNVEEAN